MITRSVPPLPKTSGEYISSALAGGAMNSPGVVARAWAAAYGVMAGLDLPDQISGSFQEKYGLSHLRDIEGPDVPRGQVEEARRFARYQVERLQYLVFPYHRV